MNPLNLFFSAVEVVINGIFILLPEVMRVFAFSILMSTIGKALRKKKGMKWRLIKALHVLFYLGWMMHKFNFVSLYSLPTQVFLVAVMVLLFIGLIILYVSRNLSFFGYRLINYYTTWVVFWIMLAVVSFFEYVPGSFGFSIFYFATSLIIIKVAK